MISMTESKHWWPGTNDIQQFAWSATMMFVQGNQVTIPQIVAQGSDLITDWTSKFPPMIDVCPNWWFPNNASFSCPALFSSHGFIFIFNPRESWQTQDELIAYSVVGLNCEEKFSIPTNWQERKTWLIGNIMPQKTERQSLMKHDTRNPRARPVLHQFNSHRQFLALAISNIVWTMRS